MDSLLMGALVGTLIIGALTAIVVLLFIAVGDCLIIDPKKRTLNRWFNRKD